MFQLGYVKLEIFYTSNLEVQGLEKKFFEITKFMKSCRHNFLIFDIIKEIFVESFVKLMKLSNWFFYVSRMLVCF